MPSATGRRRLNTNTAAAKNRIAVALATDLYVITPEDEEGDAPQPVRRVALGVLALRTAPSLFGARLRRLHPLATIFKAAVDAR